MKQFLLFAVAAFLFGAPAFAQTPTFTQVGIFDVAPEVEARCTKITRAMARELRLNEPEYIKLKELNRERMAKTEALLQTYSENSPELQEKMREIELAYEQKIVSFLTPNQLHAYANYKPELTNVKFVAATH